MPLFRRPSAFLRDDRGSLSVELVLALPLLIWAYVGMFIFFDAFQQQNVNLKASYTAADVLSRKSQDIDMPFIEGLGKMMDYLTDSNRPVDLRVSVVRADTEQALNILVWSHSTDTAERPALTQHDIDTAYDDDIPVMPNADHAIVVETWALYEPLAVIGLAPVVFDNVVVTSPRFQGPLNFVGHNDGTGGAHDDGTNIGGTPAPS